MNERITLPAPAIDPPKLTKFESEEQAFMRLLPRLRASHSGKYVAIHNGQGVDSGEDRVSLALRVLASVGNVDTFIGVVSEMPEASCRSGVRRDVRGRH
jgi:hypothetical protein